MIRTEGGSATSTPKIVMIESADNGMVKYPQLKRSTVATGS